MPSLVPRSPRAFSLGSKAELYFQPRFGTRRLRWFVGEAWAAAGLAEVLRRGGSLECLDLYNNALGDAGVEALAAALKKPIELLRVQPMLEAAFTKKWVADHKAVCPKGGKCKCLTFDLDAKVNRDVCVCRAGGQLVLPGHGVVRLVPPSALPTPRS